MVRSLLVRGLLVGLLAGLLAFAFAFVFGEPPVEAAIAFEEQMAAKAGEPATADVVSRGAQRTLGLLTGTVAVGVALGGLFALAYAYAYGRIGVAGARLTAALLALAAFVTITLVPFTKYPASPPGAGDATTLDQRTLLGFAMIAIAAAALLAAVRVHAQLAPRLGAWNAGTTAAGVFVVLVATAQLILPTIRETPPGFPADVLYDFRLASLGVNATLWLVIGLGFGAAAERLLARPAPTASA